MTNFEKIKQMSVEELAERLGRATYCTTCYYDTSICEEKDNCTECMKEWLESEVSE